MYTDETIHFTDIYLKTTSKERDGEREKYIHRDKERLISFREREKERETDTFYLRLSSQIGLKDDCLTHLS